MLYQIYGESAKRNGIAGILHWLARLNLIRGDQDTAHRQLEEVLAMKDGKDAKIMHGLAQPMVKMESYASSFYQQKWEVMHDLARAKEAHGDLDRAEHLFEKVLAMKLAKYGDYTPNASIARTLDALETLKYRMMTTTQEERQ